MMDHFLECDFRDNIEAGDVSEIDIQKITRVAAPVTDTPQRSLLSANGEQNFNELHVGPRA